MSNQQKNAFKFIGKSVLIQGNSIHEPHYSEQKTEFFAELFQEGILKNLMPYSVDKKAYALIVPKPSGIQYYAGVISEQEIEGYELTEVPAQNYFISNASGGMSRLLFDKLEDAYFQAGLNQGTVYSGGIVLEVLLNGNPADAEVELWVPINN